MTRRLLLSALGLALALAACTESEMASSPTVSVAPPTTAAGPTTTTLAAFEAVSSYEACLEANGIVIEPIPYDAAGRPRLELVMREVDLTDEDNLQALTRCAPNLSSGALDMGDLPALEQRVSDLLSEFSECLRDHGVEGFPDPVDRFSGVGGPYPLAEIPYKDPDLGDAVDMCGDELG